MSQNLSDLISYIGTDYSDRIVFLHVWYSLQGYFYRGGGRGALPPLNLDHPKRSKMWYAARGTISRPVAAAAKCKRGDRFLDIFKPFLDVL